MIKTGPGGAVTAPAVVSADTIPSSPGDGRSRWGFLEWFVVAQSAFPAFLLIPGSQALRLPLRAAPFALSLAALGWGLMRPSRLNNLHPSRWWLFGVVACLSAMIVAPATDSFLGGAAHVVLYASVLVPVFWVPRFVTSEAQLARVLGVVLVCSGINAVVGVLQVYDPARWMPTELSNIVVTSAYGLETVSFVGPDGVRIVRPPGLFDNPGAVCGPGMVAALLGLVFFMSPIAVWKKVAALLFSLAGAVAIYLSHVRSAFAVFIGMAAVYLIVLGIQKRPGSAAGFGVLLSVIALVGLSLAVALAGDSVVERFATLFEQHPLAVYSTSTRGEQLQQGFTNLLFEYPTGAGLARWGMISLYFASPGSPNASSIWVEVQPNAWIVDGGILLLVLYTVALVATTVVELRIVRSAASPTLRVWSAPIFALNVGTLGLALGFTPFTTQIGLQYWFLAGLLYGAAQLGGAPRE